MLRILGVIGLLACSATALAEDSINVEQLKLFEVLANSRFFRKTTALLLANTEGMPSDVDKKMLRKRLAVVHRDPVKLPLANVVLFSSTKPQRLLHHITKAVGDLYLARNVLTEGI